MKKVDQRSPINWNARPEKQQIAMVKRNGHNVYKITNPSEAVLQDAVSRNPLAIQNIEDPSEEAQLIAVSWAGEVIEYLNNPSSNVQLAAVHQQLWAFHHISHPCKQVINLVFKNQRLINYEQGSIYNREVRRVFKDNAILMKKWLRYGEAMRTQL